jgi:hyperosmotically inducible protein
VGAKIIVLLGAVAVGLGQGPVVAAPDESRKSDARSLDAIVVTARRLADEQLKTQVELALRDDPTLLSGHIDVSIHDGIVTLSGFVLDEWDMRIAKRIARRMTGVKRVINSIDIEQGGD